MNEKVMLLFLYTVSACTKREFLDAIEVLEEEIELVQGKVSPFFSKLKITPTGLFRPKLCSTKTFQPKNLK